MAANIPTNTTPAPTPGNAQAAGAAPVWTEAPASATLRVVTPQGYEILLTNRANTMNLLLGQLAALETWLSEHGWQPAPTRSTGGPPAQAAQGNAPTEEAAICDTCGRPMKRKERSDGKGYFWSCQTKYGSEWCKGKPKK